ncbi:DUF4148 domain-containing protein [Paraburkholderia sp. A3BS-1L]|uniref:DUF4148 domain-containing protein n=1 Tax=Paraburkholderia sp. A3BS-1L TaxID=3028375 RepID=UPI003DA99D3E
MKSLAFAAITVSVLAAPALVFAQQDGSTVTRAQVKAELIQLEKAGYNPAVRDPNYPNNIRAAEARVADQAAAQSSYGPTGAGSSSSSGSPSK